MTKNLTLSEIFVLIRLIKSIRQLDDETEKLIRESAGISTREMDLIFDKLQNYDRGKALSYFV